MKIEVGQRIKELRIEHGFNQQQIADILGIDRANYSKYELGKLELNLEMLVKLAKHYKISADYILGLRADYIDGSPGRI
ncbi:MAG: helix-turn-helix domain-containing protein [Firmicutes bacterium]|nr:helix-turn-helix domain-containing protein [Bacillota bacterium]